MPIYEYQCAECGHRFDKLVRTAAAAATVECPVCHSAHCKKAFSLFGTSHGAAGRATDAGASCSPTGG